MRKFLFLVASGIFIQILYALYFTHGIHDVKKNVPYGVRVYIKQGCFYCHTQSLRDVEYDRIYGTIQNQSVYRIPGRNRIGPDLSRIGDLRSETYILNFLKNPRGFPHTKIRISEEDLSELINYLKQQK